MQSQFVLKISIMNQKRKPDQVGVHCWIAQIVILVVFYVMNHSLALASAQDGAGKSDFTPAEQLFVRRVGPLLREKCLGCHGGEPAKVKGGLDLSSLSTSKTGGDSGEPAIVPGKPEDSPILLAAMRTSDDFSAMPPKQSDRLTEEQIAWLRQWIRDGADWPDEHRSQAIRQTFEKQWSAEDGVTVKTSGGLNDDWNNRKYRPESLWAYQPVQMPDLTALPAGKSPIDFLISKANSSGFAPAPRAKRADLLLRVFQDLTGLPPDYAEVVAFENDPMPDGPALKKVVDQLLDSPHYGERMAQHWLDVVRFADSSGFANDYHRGNAWRYRDYVIRSFNSDKPFDQFIREQVAGDELDPDNPEMLVATGFLRSGPWELTGMEVAKVARQRFLDDVTNAVGETFLGHSLQCARCHDHKFDPIPTRDYYAIQAVFATTQLADRRAEFLPSENLSHFENERYLLMRQADNQQTLDKLDRLQLQRARDWFAREGIDPTLWNRTVEQIQSKEGSPNNHRGVYDRVRTQLLGRGVPESQFPPKHLGFEPRDFGMERVGRKGLERIVWQRAAYKPLALSVYNGVTPDVKSVNAPIAVPADPMKNGDLEKTAILTGGDPFSPSEEVRPGVLSVIDPDGQAQIPVSVSGRRTAFAHWLASDQNQLTARVLANRIWQWHFGRPIAANPNNFGSTGGRPSHPELLDYLAWRLVVSGWSVKAIHREIMASEAYSLAARHPKQEALRKADPDNRFYLVFEPRRLSAEELRDALLAASGELVRNTGGIPAQPMINSDVALQPRMVMGTFAEAWVPDAKPEQRNRRSVYSLKLRGLGDPMMETFDAPTPDFSCERRNESIVTPQVFHLINSQNSHDRAVMIALRATRESTTHRAAIINVFQYMLRRNPSPDELQTCLAIWDRFTSEANADNFAQKQPPESVLRIAVEENTGEKFQFTERLHAASDFIPDYTASQLDRRIYGLSRVCLAILNSSEFSHVY